MTVEKLVKNINKYDKDYLSTLMKYVNESNIIIKKRKSIIADDYGDLLWEKIIEIQSLGGNESFLKLLSIWCDIEEKVFYQINVMEVFAMIKYVNNQLGILNEFMAKQFDTEPTSEEVRAGIKSLNKYSTITLAENIAKDFNITVDEAFKRKYSDVIMKQLYYRDKTLYETKLREVYLEKNK